LQFFDDAGSRKGKVMKFENLSLEDILGMAVKTEVQGRKFYHSLSGKVQHPEVKRKLQSLADDEIRHERIIIEMYRKTLGKEPTDLPDTGVPDIVSAITAMDISDRTQLLQVLEMAIEAELTAAKFYHQGAALTADPKTKKMFEQLEKEEDGHYNYLVAEKSALTGDLYWFTLGDSSVMEE